MSAGSSPGPARTPSPRADAFERALPKVLRKQRGAWFTPPELALATARHTLSPLHERADLRICDPAAGAGSFLLAAARALEQHDAHDAHEFVGIERDADTARLAERELHAAGVRRARIVCADGLVHGDPGSFDCVLTNPPWETLQGTGHDDGYRDELRRRFRHQGRGKLFTYRLFVERAVELLRPGGRLGMIVPASLWFDRDAEPLRRLLLEHCRWQWLFGFENRGRVFEIDCRYRFGAIVATRGGRTDRVRVAFGRTDVAEWAAHEPRTLRYHADELRRLSPHSGAFVEIESRRDLEVLTRMHARGRPLLRGDGEQAAGEHGDGEHGDGGAFTWRQGDFNMTSDRARFVLREHAERDGYRVDGDGVWRRPGAPDLLALRQGAMLYDLDGNAGAHDRGTGHATRWRRPGHPAELRPLYLVDAASWLKDRSARPPARIALRALSNATNERTAIACLLPDVPCGNSLGVLAPASPTRSPLLELAAGAAMLASLPFDWSLRMRLGGTNLNRFVLRELVLPRCDGDATRELAQLALRLCATAPWTDDLWRRADAEGWRPAAGPCLRPDHRRTLATRIDTLVGTAYGLTPDDVDWITRAPPFAKGFWRIERDLPPKQRRPARWQHAAHHPT